MNAFEESLPHNNRALWLFWTLATAALVFLANVGANNALVAFGTPALLGAVQWLLLRAWLKRPWGWVLATFFGLNIGIMIGGVLGGTIQDALDGISKSSLGIAPLEPGRTLSAFILGRATAGASIGAVLGLAQWIPLRKIAHHSYLWPLANIVGFAGFIFNGFVGLAVSSAWAGAATAGALVWCLRSPVPVEERQLAAEAVVPRRQSRLLRVAFGGIAAVLVIGGLLYYFGTRDYWACGDWNRNPQAAVVACTKLVAYPVNNGFISEAYTDRGVAYDILGQYDNSIADLNEAIRLDPSNARAYLERGMTYRDQGDNGEAIENLGEAIRIRPGYRLAFRFRGRLLTQAGQLDRAIDDFSEAIRLDQRDSEAFHYRGVAREAKGDRELAIADYRMALEIEPRAEPPRAALKALGITPD